MQKYKVLKEENIIECLTKQNIAKNKIKTLVKLGSISVNNKVINKLPYTVYPNDIITIGNKINNYDLNIVYEDKNYLVVDKKEGLLTISTSNENKNNEETLYKIVRKYLNDKK